MFCYMRTKFINPPLTVEKWLIHLMGKALKYVGENEET